MRSYPISFLFRDRRRSGLVNHFSEHAIVYFTDDEILKDFTGAIEFDRAGKAYTTKKIVAKDSLDLYRAIVQQLQW